MAKKKEEKSEILINYFQFLYYTLCIRTYTVPSVLYWSLLYVQSFVNVLITLQTYRNTEVLIFMQLLKQKSYKNINLNFSTLYTFCFV